jgi:hypothetical protein
MKMGREAAMQTVDEHSMSWCAWGEQQIHFWVTPMNINRSEIAS